MCLTFSLPLSLLSSTLISPFWSFFFNCPTKTKHALEKKDGERQEEGKGERQEGGDHERKKRDGERGGCTEPSCAKYLTLCADLPKVRFVLGAYGFSHAGVLLSALPAEGILIKEGALLPPFPSPSLLWSSSSPFLFFSPPSSLSTPPPFSTEKGMQHSRRE